MKRRDFVKRTASATALAAACGGIGWAFHDLDVAGYEAPLKKTRDFTVPENKSLPKLTLATGEDHAGALLRSLDAIGGAGRFVKKGEKVTIKPNVGWDRTPEQAADTNPVLVGKMVELCFQAGAAEVIVTDVTCNDPRRCFLRSGIREAAEAAGAKVLLPNEDDYITIDIGGEVLTSWPVLRHFVETDRLINIPIVKHHSLTGATIGMKNFYGIIGGSRHRLHQKIAESIVELTAFARPTLTVVDATRILLRGGPQGGSLDDVAIENTVMCATDIVAADARGVEFLGRKAEDIGHIVLGQKTGLGSMDYLNVGYKEV
jgi:uncharacterized protein (DUF362 family)